MNEAILGISAYYHDSAACLVVGGRIVAAAQEERFTRLKHDSGFPSHAVAYCLEQGGLRSAYELDYVVFYDKPVLKFERLLETYLRYAPRGIRSFVKAMPLWLKKKLWMRENIGEELDYDGKILFTEHHQAHAASAFFPSPFPAAAILTLDGVGEWATASLGLGEGNTIRILKEIHFPHSLGLFYSAFTYFTGFKVNSGEYKLMGLAPYGEPTYADLILDELIDLREDGSFKLNLRYFDYCAGLRMTNRRFDRLFGGPPRPPEGRLTQREMDMAASIQVVTEKVMLNMARFAREQTGSPNLVMAGGVALNCVGNGKILREGLFRRIWIQPAAGDAGGALGAALFVHHQVLGHGRVVDGSKDLQQATLLGPSYGDVEIGRFVAERGIRAARFDDFDALLDRVTDLMQQENVIGWFQGRMEFGPRALGSRSILGDARSREMQSKMNLKIKFRESFRPFAPSVMKEHARDYFELDVESPYMLLTAPVHPQRRLPVQGDRHRGLDKLKTIRSTVPAITHVDYSARIQTVSREDHPRYHRLLEKFYEKTGCPVIVNTSFNVRGEPIVATPEDAYRCFARTNMDYLVLGSYLVDRRDQSLPARDAARTKELELDCRRAKAVRRKKPGEATQARRFALILVVFFLALAAFSAWRRSGDRAVAWSSAAAAVSLSALLFFPLWLRLFRVWMKFAEALSWVMTRVILGVFYYVVLAPFALLSRGFREDPLDLAWKDGKPTYWVEREEREATLTSCEKMF
ncbi:MAG: carbamoyltransferase [Acidobacteriia bacterium]|nr:carbamoyltransferase [Terriglobia bacterium]